MSLRFRDFFSMGSHAEGSRDHEESRQERVLPPQSNCGKTVVMARAAAVRQRQALRICQFGWLRGEKELLKWKNFLVAAACNYIARSASFGSVAAARAAGSADAAIVSSNITAALSA